MSTNTESRETQTEASAQDAELKARRQLVKSGAVAGVAAAGVVGLGRKAWAGRGGWGHGGGSAGASAGSS